MSLESTQLLRVALYVRVSTEEQREGQTIDSQIKELEKFAEANRWTPAGVYKDEGWSGTMLARPELDRLRDDAQRKSFDAVLINDVDRLARDVTHLNVIRRDLERKGIRVVFRKIPGELNPTQNLMINILGSFAEFEREMIADRTRRGVRHKVEIRKLYFGCRPAYGYRYITKGKSTDGNGSLEILSEEAAVVREIYDWVDRESLSSYKVVARLNQLHIPTRNRNSWHRSTVLRILRNEIYAGTWHYYKHYSCEPLKEHARPAYQRTPKANRRRRPRTEWVSVPLPATLNIISRKQWDRVQAKLTANIAWSRRNAKHEYMLKGLVKCAACNARMIGENLHGYFYYGCHKRCRQVRRIREHLLNDTIWNAVKQALLHPEIITEQTKRYLEEHAERCEVAKRQQEESSVSILQINQEEQRVLEAYRLGVLTPEQLGNQLKQLAGRRKLLTKDSTGTSERGLSTDDLPQLKEQIEQYCKRIADVVEGLDFERKRDLLRTLIREAVFDGRKVLIRGRVPCHDTDHSNEQFSSDPDSGGRIVEPIATTTPPAYGRNHDWIETTLIEAHDRNPRLREIQFELAAEAPDSASIASAGRRANMTRINAQRWHG